MDLPVLHSRTPTLNRPYGLNRQGVFLLILGILGLSFGGLVAQENRPPPGGRLRPPPLPREASILESVEGRVWVQRAFLPFEGNLRLYGCVVGSPSGAHYGYDLETGSILMVWRGPFADLTELWFDRAFNQTAEPIEGALWMNARPLFAVFPRRLLKYPEGWLVTAHPLFSYEGYELEPDGQPVFIFHFERLRVRDRIASDSDGSGLTRQVKFSGKLNDWNTWLLVAEGAEITSSPNGSEWVIPDSGLRIQWPSDSKHRPEIRDNGSNLQLVVPLTKETLEEPLEYTLTW